MLLIGPANAFYMSAVIIARLEGWVTWSWWVTILIALAPFCLVALGCLWAVMFDSFHPPQRR